MTLLFAIVAILSVVVLFQMVVTLGLIRRVRLIQEGAQLASDPDGNAEPGTVIGAFSGTDQDGRLVTEQDLQHGETLVGFFSSGCSTCSETTAQLAANPPAERFVAFVDAGGGPGATNRLISSLKLFAQIVLIDEASSIMSAFEVVTVPRLVRVHRGVVVAAGAELRDVGLGGPVAAAAPA